MVVAMEKQWVEYLAAHLAAMLVVQSVLQKAVQLAGKAGEDGLR